MTQRVRLGPILYGAIFVVALPVLLVAWARATADAVRLPALHAPVAGIVLALAGLAFMASGMRALRVHGHGLPMNAYPPPLLVRAGIYRFLSHPIYVGFIFACAGVSVAAGSASGLWLVTPATALGTVALVLGHERRDLLRRFGDAALARPLIALPAASPSPPVAWERVAVILLVLVPWMLAYEGVRLLGVPHDAVETWLPFERDWPVLAWTWPAYAGAYLFAALVPFVPRRRDVLRDFAVTGLLATAFVTFAFVTLPLVTPPRPFAASGILGRCLELERLLDTPGAAFPAFHVIWALIAARAWARTFPRAAALAWTGGFAITASCLTTGMHSLLDVTAGLVTWLVLERRARLWELLRAGTERVANSWREWQLGGVRVLSHAFMAAAAAATGTWILGALGGPRLTGGIVLVSACALLGAGLWAQKLEGSSQLSRPFGYFGALVGGTAGLGAAAALGFDEYLLAAALGAACPWVQAIGRLRCLVQGCCHGAPAPDGVGIRYRMPRARVVQIAGLAGVPLHPTPLYSILCNVAAGILLARLWSVHASLGLVAGLYLVLSGLCRFVEESFRGEPQTPVVWGLRLYQWLSVVLVLAGVGLTLLPAREAPEASLGGSPALAAAAAGVGLLAGFLMGVDFPRSGRRFARLAPT